LLQAAAQATDYTDIC